MSRIADRPVAPVPPTHAPRRRKPGSAREDLATQDFDRREVATYGFDAVEAIVTANEDARRGFVESDAVIEAARFVRAVRERSGLSQRQLARKLAMEPSQLSKIERGVGTQGPTLKTLARIADACGLRLELRACAGGG